MKRSCPDEENHKKYNEYFRLYKSIYNHLKEDMKDLTKAGNSQFGDVLF